MALELGACLRRGRASVTKRHEKAWDDDRCARGGVLLRVWEREPFRHKQTGVMVQCLAAGCGDRPAPSGQRRRATADFRALLAAPVCELSVTPKCGGGIVFAIRWSAHLTSPPAPWRLGAARRGPSAVPVRGAPRGTNSDSVSEIRSLSPRARARFHRAWRTGHGHVSSRAALRYFSSIHVDYNCAHQTMRVVSRHGHAHLGFSTATIACGYVPCKTIMPSSHASDTREAAQSTTHLSTLVSGSSRFGRASDETS